MKRLVLLLLVFVVAVLAINIYNVKAEEIEAVENENNQTEIAEEEKQEEKKEEVVEVVETPVATESTSNEEAVKTTKGANVKVAAEEKKSCKVTIIFKELSDSGVAINSGNGVNQNLTNTISLNGSASKVSRKLARTTFTSGNKFTVDGWYSDSELKNPVPETMWYDANTKTRIKVSFTCTEDSPEEVTFTYYLKWNEEKAPIYNFHLYDKHGHRSHDWSNTDGHFGDFSFTFKDPADVETHYSFLYYKDESQDHVYNPGDEYEHNVTNQGANTNVTENFYAWYKADVTLSLYDGTKTLGSKSQFDSISINDVLEENPTKEGYVFVGWVDEEKQEVTDTTFEANEEGIDPKPREVKLYAKWNKLVKVTKKWNDNNNNDRIRPDKVTVYVKKGNEKLANKELSEDNNWTYTFEVSNFDEKDKDSYSVEEDQVEGYNGTVTGDVFEGFIIENKHEDYKYEKVTVKKEWEDKDNMNNSRPNSVTVHLKRGEEEVSSIELNEENGWEASFENVVKLENGETIEYSIEEDSVEGYEQLSLEGDMENGFVITNEYVLGQGGDIEEKEEENKTDNPQTGDSIVNSVLMLLMSLFGFVSGLVYLKKNN